MFPLTDGSWRCREPQDTGGSAPSTLVLLITGIDRRRWQERHHLHTSQLLFCSHLRSALRATASPCRFERSHTTRAGSVRQDQLHPRGLRQQQEVRGGGYGRGLRIPFCVWLPATTAYKPPARRIILQCCARALIQI